MKLNGSDRAVARALGSGWGLQVAMLICAVATLPIVTRTLTAEEYGIYATVSTLMILVQLADLGVAGFLTDRLGALGLARRNRIRADLLSNSIAVAAGSAIAIFVCLALVISVIDVADLLGSRTVPRGQLLTCLFTALLAICISTVGNLGNAILAGVQKVNVVNRFLATIAIVSAFLIIVASMAAAPLWVIVACATLVPATLSLVWTALVIRRLLPDLHLALSLVSGAGVLEVLRPSKWHLLIGIAAIAGYQIDIFVVAAVLGAPDAGIFAIAGRAFAVVVGAFYPATAQLWPVFREALARGDREWVWRRYRMTSGLIFASVFIVSALLGFALPTLVDVALVATLSPPTGLVFTFILWTTYSVSLGPTTSLFNATDRAKHRAILAAIAAVANLPLSIAFTRAFGLPGPLLGSFAASALCLWVPYALLLRQIRAECYAPTTPPHPPLPRAG